MTAVDDTLKVLADDTSKAAQVRDDLKTAATTLNDLQNTLSNLVQFIENDITALSTALHPVQLPAGPTVYHQRDYSGVVLGKSRYTIGSSGCLLCSTCSCENDAGLKMDPVQFNAWLLAHGGFSADNEGQIVNFVYAAADALGYLKFDALAYYPNKPPTPAPIDAMDRYLKAGGFVVVEVDFNPQTAVIDQHWCRYLGSGNPQGDIMDPWYGDVADVAKRYKPGYTAKEAIIAAAYYKRVSA